MEMAAGGHCCQVKRLVKAGSADVCLWTCSGGLGEWVVEDHPLKIRYAQLSRRYLPFPFFPGIGFFSGNHQNSRGNGWMVEKNGKGINP